MASSICNACLELARVSRVAEVSEVVLLFLLSSSCMRYSESTDTVAGAGNCAPSPHSPHSHGAGHCDTALVTDWYRTIRRLITHNENKTNTQKCGGKVEYLIRRVRVIISCPWPQLRAHTREIVPFVIASEIIMPSGAPHYSKAGNGGSRKVGSAPG